MRKFLISVLIMTSIASVGCSKTIVLEENTSKTVKAEEIIEEFNIEEIPVSIDGDFYPIIYKDNNVIGINYEDFTSDKKEISYINEEGQLGVYTSTDEFVEGEILDDMGIAYRGIVKEREKINDVEVVKYYYVDKIKNKKFKLEKMNDLILSHVNNYKEAYLLSGNDNYYILDLKGYYSYSGDLDEQRILIIDIENEKLYKFEIEEREEEIVCLYFDKNLNSIMAILIDGKVKKVNINDDTIELEDYKSLNLQGYKLSEYSRVYNQELNSNKIFLNVSQNRYGETERTAIYDINSEEFIIPEEEIYINNVIGKNNLVNLVYKEEAYLGQVREDNTINYLYKFTKENYKCYGSVGIANEEGDKIFFYKYFEPNENDEYKYDASKYIKEYSFLKLTEK